MCIKWNKEKHKCSEIYEYGLGEISVFTLFEKQVLLGSYYKTSTYKYYRPVFFHYKSIGRAGGFSVTRFEHNGA